MGAYPPTGNSVTKLDDPNAVDMLKEILAELTSIKKQLELITGEENYD